MRTTAWILATLLAIAIGVALNQRATAEGPDGACIASCNEDCNQLSPAEGSRKECKTRCFAGRCAHPGAIHLAELTADPGVDCDTDGVCNEFCEEGPVPDEIDCGAPVVCPCDIDLAPMSWEAWGVTPIFYCDPSYTRLYEGQQITSYYYVGTNDPSCAGGPVCIFSDVQWDTHCIDLEQAQACADAIGAYAIALDDVQDITVDYNTDPASCPPLELP